MQIANWTVLDQRGAVWSVSCHCGYKTSFAAALMTRPPKCKRCGASAAKPVQAPPPITQLRAGPGQPFTPVDKPVDKMASPQVVTPIKRERFPALIGKRPASEMEADSKPVNVAKVKEPKPPKPPKPPREPKPPKELKPSRLRPGPTVEVGQVIHGLTVLGDAPKFAGRAMVTCRCECGTVRDFLKWHTAKGNIQSCGCRKDKAAALKHNERVTALPGDVFGSLTVLSEAERNKGTRCVLTECRHCKMVWKVQVTNLRRVGDHCACESRLRQSSEGRLRRQERLREAEARRQRYRHLTHVRQIDNQIRYHQDRIALLVARRDALTPAATVAQ
jgi:hypothetical protein